MTSRESVEKNGFAVIPAVLSPSEIARILDDLKDATLRRSKAGVRHAMDSAGIAQLSRQSELLAVAQEVLGKGAFPFRATLFVSLLPPTGSWSGIKTLLYRFANGTTRPVGDLGQLRRVSRTPTRPPSPSLKCWLCEFTWTIRLRGMGLCESCQRPIRMAS